MHSRAEALDLFNKIIIEDSPIGICVYRSDGTCIFANPAIAQIVGVSVVQVESQNFTKIDSWKKFGLYDAAMLTLNQGIKVTGKTKLVSVFGKTLYLSYTFSRAEKLDQVFLVGQFVDLSKELETNMTLAESQETLGAIFEYAPIPFMFFNDQGILDCNRAAVNILGHQEKSDIVGRHPAEFSPETQPDGELSREKSLIMDSLAHTVGKHTFEWMHRKENGDDLLVEVTLVPILISKKNVMLTLWRDLTDIKEKERRLIESSKMAGLGEMSAGIAHEVNNPLAVILGKVSQMQRLMGVGPVPPEKIAEFLTKIQTNAERIGKIITGLKSFTRNSENDPKTPANISQIIDDTLEIIREKLNSKKVELIVRAETDSRILCRQAQILQVLTNLISNSLDAVDELPQPWVKIETSETENELIIKVTDSGSGIPENIRKKMMLPFYTTKSNGRGTGLGLSISKKLIEEHMGKFVYDESSPNTCFVISLPKYVEAPLAKAS